MEGRKINVFEQETIEEVLKTAAENVIKSDFLVKNGKEPDLMTYMIMGMTGAIYMAEYKKEIKRLLGILKMHLVICDFRGELIDPDTGQSEEYLFSGSGSDNGDKALYKAVTGGLKYFLAANFNVAEDNDPENDGEAVVDTPKYTTPEKREEVKEQLLDKDGKATKMQINSLKKALKLLREADPEQEGFIAAIAEKTDGFTNIKKKACEELILKVGEMIEGTKERSNE
jgi:hypothetical protein